MSKSGTMKVFRSTERRFVGCAAFFLLAVILAGFLVATTHDLIEISPLFAFVVWSAYGYMLVRFWLNMETKIIVSDDSFVNEHPLSRREIPWEKISEVGIYRKVVPSIDGLPVNVMVYVQSSTPSKRFVINISSITDAHELISMLFQKATKAKFVRIENRSPIPFLRQPKLTEWKRNDGASVT